MRQRHSYELHTARVLCTEAEPRLVSILIVTASQGDKEFKADDFL